MLKLDLKFLKSNVVSLAVLVLLIMAILQRCGDKPVSQDPPLVIRDTVWIIKDTFIISKPQVVSRISVLPSDTIINNYLPDTNCAKLLVQYQNVVNELLVKNIQEDSIRIDTNRYVKITDTVQKNVVIGRSSYINISYPVVREYIKDLPKNQVYIGGGIQGVPGLNAISAGALFKNKKDQIFIGSLGITTKGDFQYGVQSFWKIKLTNDGKK
jgi:hypothetical protein